MVVINGDTGIDKVQSGAVEDGDLNLSVKPMFSAYQSVAQSLTASTWTKLNFQSEEFDLTNAYDTTTMRFTPQKSGYYQVSCSMYVPGTPGFIQTGVYKNGSAYKYGTTTNTVSTLTTTTQSCIVYLNGTTDYIEIFGEINASISIGAGISVTYFQAHYIGS